MGYKLLCVETGNLFLERVDAAPTAKKSRATGVAHCFYSVPSTGLAVVSVLKVQYLWAKKPIPGTIIIASSTEKYGGICVPSIR